MQRQVREFSNCFFTLWFTHFQWSQLADFCPKIFSLYNKTLFFLSLSLFAFWNMLVCKLFLLLLLVHAAVTCSFVLWPVCEMRWDTACVKQHIFRELEWSVSYDKWDLPPLSLCLIVFPRFLWAEWGSIAKRKILFWAHGDSLLLGSHQWQAKVCG